MTEQQCITYLHNLNNNEKNFKIIINPMLDLILEKCILGIAQPTKYKRYFAIKYEGQYIGLFFENFNNDEQEDLQFFIDKNFRGKINYYDIFNNYIFPILFNTHEKIKISFKNSKIKEKMSNINVLSSITQLKGNKVTLNRKHISEDLLKNNFSIYSEDDKSLHIFLNTYKEIYNRLKPKLKIRFDLIKIIRDEKFSSVNNNYIEYYFQLNYNKEELIKEFKKLIELYFIIEHYYKLLYKDYKIELNKI